jgi:hypothetical protein
MMVSNKQEWARSNLPRFECHLNSLQTSTHIMVLTCKNLRRKKFKIKDLHGNTQLHMKSCIHTCEHSNPSTMHTNTPKNLLKVLVSPKKNIKLVLACATKVGCYRPSPLKRISSRDSVAKRWVTQEILAEDSLHVPRWLRLRCDCSTEPCTCWSFVFGWDGHIFPKFGLVSHGRSSRD